MAQSISWSVIERKLPGARTRLISKHASQEDAEAECAWTPSSRATLFLPPLAIERFAQGDDNLHVCGRHGQITTCWADFPVPASGHKSSRFLGGVLV